MPRMEAELRATPKISQHLLKSQKNKISSLGQGLNCPDPIDSAQVNHVRTTGTRGMNHIRSSSAPANQATESPAFTSSVAQLASAFDC